MNTCAICLAAIRPGDATTSNERGGLMHAECDPAVIRCPECDAPLNALVTIRTAKP